MGAPTRQIRRIRRDGWTAERQLKFLDALARTRSVTRAAACVGMSRESAYRLRKRGESVLFAAAWDRALEGHRLIKASSRRRGSAPRVSGGKQPKVTKWKKYTAPRFDSLLRQLRDVVQPTT